MCTGSSECAYAARWVEFWGLSNLSHEERVHVPRNTHVFFWVHLPAHPFATLLPANFVLSPKYKDKLKWFAACIDASDKEFRL